MELSERLKALAKDFGGVRHWSRPTFAAQNLAGEVADNLPAILAALQFAEDVKRLSQHGGVWIVEQNNGKYEAIFAIRGKANHFYGETPQHAARKAVEALTKGEA